MIDINDYNREDLIASCLIEAANIMSNVNTNTEVLEEGTQADEYKARKAKEKANTDGQDARNAIYRNIRKENAIGHNNPGYYKKVKDARKKYNSRLINDAMNTIYSDKIPSDREVADRINADNAITRKAEKDIKKTNKKVIGESTYDHLDFADAVLDILNDYDY